MGTAGGAMIRCEGCGRHVRAVETSCPFCAASSRRGAAAHKALQVMGGAATSVVLAACYGAPDGYKPADSGYGPYGGDPTTGLITGDPTGSTIDISVQWSDDGGMPADTDGDGVNETNCAADTVEIAISDPLGQVGWEFGMVEQGTYGWTGEDCIGGATGFQHCHAISAPSHTLTEVCTPGEIVDGQTTLLDASKGPFLTYVLTDTDTGWCVVFGADPAYYDSLGCQVSP